MYKIPCKFSYLLSLVNKITKNRNMELKNIKSIIIGIFTDY